MRPNVQPLVDSPTLHRPTLSVRSLQLPTDLQQPPVGLQQQPCNLQQQPFDLISPTMGEDILDSLGEPSVPGWSAATEQGQQAGRLVGDESEMQGAIGNAGTLPSADDLVPSLTSMSIVKVVSFLASDGNAQNLVWMQRRREQRCWNLHRLPPP